MSSCQQPRGVAIASHVRHPEKGGALGCVVPGHSVTRCGSPLPWSCGKSSCGSQARLPTRPAGEHVLSPDVGPPTALPLPPKRCFHHVAGAWSLGLTLHTAEC